MIPIRELKEGDSIRDMYAVRQKETPREYRSKEGKYFFLVVGDKTGEIPVKYWGGSDSDATMELYNSFKKGDVVEITGEVEFDRFADRLVVKMSEDHHRLRVCNHDEYKITDFLPTSSKDLDKLYTSLLTRMGSIKDPFLKHLVGSLVMDGELSQTLRTAPSSMVHHHNYIGGHLEHTINVVNICDKVADSYPNLNRDLLISGAMLYDIGKLKTYTYSASIDMTDQGQFIGHTTLGYGMVKEKIEEIEDFPEEIAMKMLHIMVSHHGDSEKYSTRRFRIPEACVIHHADSMDSQIQEFLEELENDEEGEWTYSRRLGHTVYRGD